MTVNPENKNVLGVDVAAAPALFETDNYPFIYKDLEKCAVHVCQDCINRNTTDRATAKASPILYQELSYLLRKKLALNYLESKGKK